ncbi:DUF6790 family protein [Desulfogranum marinum]|uniref:DUF6790 family protein n=1 Tax=Desulfogranum marinum TaxID=453220 RepID=UPI001963CDCE|nr:DUF6790 family protein [Desulfogranum marinum]MBM9514621.1 hypothetical protein [Desulfogranum marinum]
MVASLIKLVLSNPSVSLLFLGLISSLISLNFKKKPLTKSVIIEDLVAFFFLFSIGIGYLNNFLMHVVFAEYTAKFIGWPNSPFQLEVGFASLGMGVAGLIAFRQNLAFRVATFIPPAFFLLGAAGGHIYQIFQTHNMASGNAGTVLWTDILLPIIGFALLYAQTKILRGATNY